MTARQARIERAQERLMAWDARIEDLTHQVHSRGRPRPSQMRSLRRILQARTRVLDLLGKVTSPNRARPTLTSQLEQAWGQLRRTWKSERQRLRASIETGCSTF